MNNKVKTEIAVGVILLVAIIVGGIFYWQSKKVQMPVQRAVVPTPVVQQPTQTAVNQQIAQTPQAGYKLVRVSDGTTSFSFQIPEKWLTETRHSGEKQLTTEEMRDFLATNYDGDIKINPKLNSDYADMPWKLLKEMSPKEVARYYFKSDEPSFPFPNASVAAGDHIWYTDTSWQQIDFYIKNESVENVITKVKKEQENYCKQDANMAGCGEIWSQIIIDGKDADTVKYPTDRDEKGHEFISKGGTGGSNYYIKISDNKTLVIDKQAKGDAKFETDFNNLIQTFKFTK